MKIKIAHVTQSLGGVRTYLESIFQHTDPKNFKYIIIAPEHTEFQEFCRIYSVTYYPIKIQRSINPLKDIAAFIKILMILWKEKPNVVHTHSAKGGFLGRLAATFTSAKVIYAPHAFSYLSFKGLKRVLFYAIEYIAQRWTDMLLAVSYSEANRAIYEVGYEKEKVKTILNAVEVDGHLPFRNYQKCNRIGMIARLTYQKNPLMFIDVAATLLKKNPDLEFSILGAGLCDHLSDEICNYLEENNLTDKIKILGWGDAETSRNFLADTDIFVMTSVFEGLPFSLVEAMAQGIPSVVSKVDGNTDVIQNFENGFACLNENEFCSKIELLIDSEDLRRKLGQAGYRYVKSKHNIGNTILALQNLYIQLYNNEPAVETFINVEEQQEQRIHLKVSPSI